MNNQLMCKAAVTVTVCRVRLDCFMSTGNVI